MCESLCIPKPVPHHTITTHQPKSCKSVRARNSVVRSTIKQNRYNLSKSQETQEGDTRKQNIQNLGQPVAANTFVAIPFVLLSLTLFIVLSVVLVWPNKQTFGRGAPTHFSLFSWMNGWMCKWIKHKKKGDAKDEASVWVRFLLRW